MTTPITPILTGRDIGAAQRATRALLDRLLDAAGLPFDQWTVLFTIGGSGPLPASVLVQGQVEGLKVTPGVGRTTVAAVVDAGLIAPATGPDAAPVSTDDPVLDFTPEGEGVYAPIRQAVDQITAELYSDLPAADLEATHRTLTEVTRRANARLAAAS
jgi:DNA-binding MarR family transcriptional regulator